MPADQPIQEEASNVLSTAARRTIGFARRHPAAAGLASVLALYFITRLIMLHSVPYFCDEGVYIRWAQEALYQHRWFVTLADGKVPLHPWVMIPFLKLFGDPLTAGRVTTVFTGALTVAGVFLLGRELKDYRLGLLSAFLYLICPYALWKDRLALAEGLLLTLTVFAAWFTVIAVRRENPWFLAGTAACVYLALMTKGTAFYLFFILPFAWVISEPDKRKKAHRHPLGAWLVQVGAALAVAYGLYSLLHLKFGFGLLLDVSPTRTMTISKLMTHPFTYLPGNTGSIIRNSFNLMTPVLWLTCLAGLITGAARRWRPAFFLSVWFLVVWLVVSATSLHPYPRFYLGMLPPLLIGAAYAVVSLYGVARGYGSRGRDRGAVITAACVVALLSAIIVPAGVKAGKMVASPARAGLPDMIKSQYIDKWSAGWGLEDAAGLLEKEAGDGRITVATDSGFFPGFALATYFFDNPNIDYLVYPAGSSLPPEVLTAASQRPTYLVLNDRARFPGNLPVLKLKSYDKPKGKHLFVVRVVPQTGG